MDGPRKQCNLFRIHNCGARRPSWGRGAEPRRGQGGTDPGVEGREGCSVTGVRKDLTPGVELRQGCGVCNDWGLWGFNPMSGGTPGPSGASMTGVSGDSTPGAEWREGVQ